ncbi:MAG: hypothetical protein ACQESZ_03220 [Bacteroidota bacterium]
MPKQDLSFTEIAKLFDKHQKKTEQLQQKLHEANSLGKSLEIKSKIDLEEEKFVSKFNKVCQQIHFPAPISVMNNAPKDAFRIKNVSITDIDKTGLVHIAAEIEYQNDSISPFAYAVFVDENGQRLDPNHYVILSPPSFSRGEITNHINQQSFLIEGVYHCVTALEHADAILFKTEEAYLANK